MNKTAMVVLLAITISPMLSWPVGTVAQAPDQAASPAAENNAAAASAFLQAVSASVGRRTDVNVAWSDADAQRKAAQFLGAHHAHRSAIQSLQQCHSCHGGMGTGWSLDAATIAAMQPKGPWLGVSVGPADGVLRSQLRLPEGAGVVVTQVMPNGPAEQAGVEVDDVLLSVNGKPVGSGDDLDKILQSAKPDGPPLMLKLLHAGEAVEKHVTPRKADGESFVEAVNALLRPAYRIGVNIAPPDQTLRRHLKLGNTGLVVNEVLASKPADVAGVKSGDVLLSANGRQLTTPEDLTDEVLRARESPLELELLRGGVKLKIGVTPAKEQAAADVGAYLDIAVGIQPQQTRELMLVHPGSAQVLTDVSASINQVNKEAATADRLNRITEQLDKLHEAVDALRQDLEQQRQTKPRDGR